MRRFFLFLLFHLMFILLTQGQDKGGLLDPKDLKFLEQITQDVMDSARIYPGQSIPSFGKNNTHTVLIRPGGRDDYPAFWIRDYAMSVETGMVTSQEQKKMLLLTASAQCNQTWLTKWGSLVPFGAIPDHIRIDDSMPIYFPGTYDYSDQGNPEYGMMPPYCDQFFFIQMAYYYVRSSHDKKILLQEIKGLKLIDRLEIAFNCVATRPGSPIVFTNEHSRAVDFGFRDAIVITGDLCFSSILKYQAAIQLAKLFDQLPDKKRAERYRQISFAIKKAIPPLFAGKDGLLLASTGISRQPDVWATALAIYYQVLEGAAATAACKALKDAYENGSLAYKGNIRHILKTDDYNETSAWEKTKVEKNRYQNGAYWGTPTGWVCFAIAKADRQQARLLAKEFINDLRDNDFRKGSGYGAPYECFYPPSYSQNPLYLATVACPYIVFKSMSQEQEGRKSQE